MSAMGKLKEKEFYKGCFRDGLRGGLE